MKTTRSARSVLCALLVGTTLFGSPGCATILGKAANQPVDVTTTPPGARLIVNGVPTDVTSPGTVELDPGGDHVIGAQLGQAKGQSAVRKHIRAWSVIVNGLLTAGLGVVVDYLTGALYSVEPKLQLNLGVSPVAPDRPPPGDPVTPKRPPNRDPNGGTTNLLESPCSICGEPRGNKTPCPHCGME